MLMIWDEQRIRAELKRLDKITGLKGATLPVEFGNARCVIGSFNSRKGGSFRFSNYWYQNPEWPEECALETIRHEYAHYMDWVMYGKIGHGTTWKKCCGEVGAIAVRLYNQDVERYYLEKHKKEMEINQQGDMFDEGDLLLHPKYGFGEIKSVAGEGVNRYIIVEFDAVGTKKIAVKWAIENCEIEKGA